jgi:hypothetical protein
MIVQYLWKINWFFRTRAAYAFDWPHSPLICHLAALTRPSPGPEAGAGSSFRFGFGEGGCSSHLVEQLVNSLTHFLPQEYHFPLTLPFSPIGGEGEKLSPFNVLWLLNPVTSFTPSPPASGREGWGEGGKTTACNCLTGLCWEKGRLADDFPPKTLIFMCKLAHKCA